MKIKTDGSKWRVAAYARLSRDDGGEGESNSIAAQVGIIEDWAASRGDIEIVEVYKDDGVSGTTFDRPAFNHMMHDAEAGLFDAVVVKDQSRFGRSYLEMGRLVDYEMPRLGVRLLSIADDFDSADPRDYSTAIIFPVKNIVNEHYASSTSRKIRTSLAARRSRGMVVASFAPYGYVKDPADRHRFVVDPPAADVVRRIFELRLDGYSARGIANMLNGENAPTPLQLKRQRGCTYATSFGDGSSGWHAKQVCRVLSDEVYLGTLVQGKTRRPSWRSKESIPVDPRDRSRVEDAHEAIVDARTFAIAADLSRRGPRIDPADGKARLLAGMTFCSLCGRPLRRRTAGLLSCSANRGGQGQCPGVRSREDRVEHAVRTAIRLRATSPADAGVRAREADRARMRRERDVRRARDGLEAALAARESLSEALTRGLIDLDEYTDILVAYETCMDDCTTEVENAERQEADEARLAVAGDWTSPLARWCGDESVDRRMVVELIDRVEVGPDVARVVFRPPTGLGEEAVPLKEGA